MPDIITQLKALKLHGMADSYAELVSQGRMVQQHHWHLLNGCCGIWWKRNPRIARYARLLIKCIRRDFRCIVIWMVLTLANPVSMLH